jgi:diguanylate cyclase
MPDGFFLGVVFALAILAVGLLAGIVVGHFVWRPQRTGDAAELNPVLNSLVQFTSRFSQDVSENRTLIETAAERARQLNQSAADDDGSAAQNSTQLLAQIIEANEHLRRRLDEAEASLQDKSEELNSYMTEARTDALTGLPNRRAFDDELSRRMSLYRRQAQPFGVLLLDVDRFKSVNDRFGHHMGDQVLRTVATALRGAVRDCDLLARYGGEEFCVLLAGNTCEEFIHAAERVRDVVENTEITCDGSKLSATVSCGVAEATGGEDTVSLVRRADEALYASKSGGRNCSHWHDGRRAVRITSSDAAAGDSKPTPPPPPSASPSESFRDVCAELRRKLMELAK